MADYKEDAFRTFDPEDKEGLPARSAIFKAVLDGIKKYKSEGILAAQADFVCHSLGGLHTKAFAQQFFNKANNNFNQGYVHKLVTLGTPHKGSPLGPLLYNMEDYVHLYGSLSGSTLLTLVPLNWILEWGGLPVGTVHRDFETNVSRNPALQRLDASNKHGIKKAHAIIGIAAKDDYQPMERLSQLLFRQGLTALFLTDQHDLIVGKNSQTGGLTSSLQVTYFTSTAHSNPPGLESLGFHTETTNPSIHNKVAALLQSADPGFFAPGFPAPSAIRDGRIMNEKAENNPAFEGSPGQRVQTRKDSVAIRLTPASRNVLVKADARHFEITLEPINGAVIKDPLVLMGAIGWIAMPQKAPYTVQVTLPETTKLVGRVPFCVLARDSSGVFLADTSSLDIEPPGAFYKLEVYPETISLDSLFRRASVQPAAWFIIGQDTVRYALDPAVGVTYSSLNSRVMVKGNGVVEGLQPGTDSIKVTYGGKTVYVPVSIDGNFTANDQLPNSVAIDLADKEVGDNPFVLQGRAVSGGTVAYKLIKGPVALQNDVAIIKGPGKVTLEASAKGDAYFRDAPAVQASFCINPAQPVAIQGDTTTCTGEKAYLLRRDPGTVYHWKIEGGALLRQRGDTAYINWTSPGSHQISVVAQVDGCTGKAREQVITVTTPASLPPLTTLGKPELCSGSSLALSASVTGKVQWFRNDTLVLGTEEPTLVVRKGGAYRVKAANKGCQASSPALVVNELAVPAVQIQVSGNTTLCAGDQVALMATQGAGYQWIKDNALVPLENTQSLSVGTAGRYRAIVAFANGCADTSAAVQVQVNQPPPVPSIYSEGAPTLCAGEVRVLTSSAGKGNQWYKDGILLPGATSQHFSVDKTGNYSLSVQADGCSSALSSVFQVEVIPLPAAPSIALQGKPILCPGGSLELTSSIEENEWLLNGVRIPGANGPELQVKNPGTYTAITVQKGCRSLPSKAVVIEAGSIPSGSIVAPTTLLCPGGAVPLKASGGQSYQWYLGQSPIPGARSADYQATKPGLYSVELSGENGCNAKAQNSITLTEAVKPDVAFDYKPVCQGLPLQFNNTSNTTTGVTWHWDFGDQTTPSQVAAPTHTFSKAGIFRVRLTATVESCTNLQETAEKLVTVEEPAMAVRYPTLFAVRGKSYPLSARPLGVAYHWRPAIEVSDPFSRTPVLTPTAERRYTVRITTVSGCTINDTLEVKLITKSEVFVPKAFSPDGNGSNDRLRPILLGIEEIRSFRVFNRWGQLVYQTQKVGEGWDGTIRGVRQPSEAYTWVFEGIDGDGKPVKASGKSLLIR
ncbi:MAG TPA: PKD domain-containing protein [Chitinophagaceae bacterium]|nr:PKD domain-containing protein [Chitinophagaceae bacterium]